MIRIVSKKAGFRRCGVSHPDKAVDYPDGRFTAAQIEALKKEPMLVVQELPDPEPDPKPGKKAAAGKADGDQGKGE